MPKYIIQSHDLTVRQYIDIIDRGFDSLSHPHATMALAVIDLLGDHDMNRKMSIEEYDDIYEQAEKAVAQVA